MLISRFSLFYLNELLLHEFLIFFIIISFSGIVLREALNKYEGIEAYQPVINGVGGNLVSIFSARLSTEICRDPSTFGKWPKWAPKRFFTYPFHTFFGKKSNFLIIYKSMNSSFLSN